MGSTTSTISTLSRDDTRRRPPPLIIANDPAGRNRLSLEVLRSNGTSTPPNPGSFYRDESEGISTPTSTTYSTGQNSPGGISSTIGSPASGLSRNSAYWDGRSHGHGRRLSVPSSKGPFQSPANNAYGSPYLSPLPSSQASVYSNLSGSFGSPIGNGPNISQHNSLSAAEEWRRRTWHPSSQTYTNYSRPATSGLLYQRTPEAAGRPTLGAPLQAAPPAAPPQRLPGIETFDQIPPGHQSPSAAPLHADPNGRPPVYPGPSMQPSSGPNDRRGHASWDLSLHQNLTRLDIAGANSGSDQTTPHKSVILHTHRESSNHPPSSSTTGLILESSARPMDDIRHPSPTPNRAKRQGWYAGPPVSAQSSTSQPRTSPGESSSSEGQPTTPSYHAPEQQPVILHGNGYVEPSQSRSLAPRLYQASCLIH